MKKLCVAIFAALATLGAAHAQQNPNCFNASLPPTTRIDACSNILDADPRHAQAYQARAVAWLEMRDYDEAIEDFTQAIAIDPKYVQSFYGRGLAWEKRGRLQKALDDFQYFVSVNPSVEGLAAVARVTSARQRIEAAAMKVEKAHAAEPTSPFVSSQPSQPMSAASPQIRRLALVIGNDAYIEVPRLKKAVGDADAIAETLRNIGFAVTVGKNLTFQQSAALISDFEQGLSKSDIVFFHFSGHGVQIKGDNILLPVDTPKPKEGQEGLIQRYGLSAQTLLQNFSEKGASLTIAILDACRDNPFAVSGTRGIGGPRGLTALSPVEGTFVIYSAGANQTALDNLGVSDRAPTSVFTRVVLPLLKAPNLSLIEIAKKAQVQVRDLARTVGHEQTPAYYDQVVGNVMLVQR